MMGALLRAPHDAYRAVMGEFDGRPLVLHYESEAAEYSAVRNAAGVIERGDLALLRLWGRDPVRMLNGLITNDLAGAQPGRAVYGAMLTAKGKVISDLRALRWGSAEAPEVVLAIPAAALDSVRKHFQRFIPPLYARWEELSDRWGVLGVYGPRSAELLTIVSGSEITPAVEDAVLELDFGGERLTAVGAWAAGGEPGFDLLIPGNLLPNVWEALIAAGRPLGVRPFGFTTLETLRIEAGRPRFGRELVEDTIATEAYESIGQLERAISFTKGCYTGQEVIIRIAHRGRVNRHLRGLLLGDQPLPAPGSPIHHLETGKEVGRITSATLSPRMSQGVALGYIRRELSPGAPVRIGAPDGPEATVTTLPFSTAPD